MIKYQRRLEEELRRPYLNLSLHQTVYQLTLENNHKLAKQLRKEFKIPDRRSGLRGVDALVLVSCAVRVWCCSFS